jgi:NAD+ synthase
MDYNGVIRNLRSQIRSYVGSRRAIIGISGGIDSAVVSTLCTKALGRWGVFGVLMPYGAQDMRDASILASILRIDKKEVNIKEIVDGFDFLGLDKISKGNLMARVRMATLYTFSNQLEGMVIGTSNKSELELGYFTKYGDGGVDLEPIGDLYKTEVYEIAKVLGIPKNILEKKPSAGLWEGQTDEDELGLSYEQIDRVLKGELNGGEAYERVQRLRKDSEHKRNLPATFKIKGL